MKKILVLLFTLLLFSCKNDKEKSITSSTSGNQVEISYAEGFNITDYGDYKILIVTNPFPKSEKSFRYLLKKEGAEIPTDLEFDHQITIPVKKIVVTSTTHIPSLETLNVEETLIGFPSLDYISSERTRSLIAEGNIRELGKNESINTELLLDLQPDVVVDFAIDGNNKTFNTIQKSGIPVVYNADWTENTSLGKAEWIKFFGALYNKLDEAQAAFKKVKNNYLEARKLAQTATERPTVLSGAMYKDVWYLPYGNSWQAQFIDDANAEYVYSHTKGDGSISLSIESVLENAKNADFWTGPAQFTSYSQMKNESQHYSQFEAFKNRNIYTFSSKKGETGGVLFYELAPNRPDLVLKDLIKVFHPQLLPDYELVFFEPLTD